MGPLVEALLVFVGIPAIALTALAAVLYGAVMAMSHVSGRTVQAAAPASSNLVAFPGPRPIVVVGKDEGVRRAA